MAWLALRSVRSSRPFLRVLTQRRFASNDQLQAIKPFSEIPGPKGLPILGSLLDVARTINKAGDENYFHQQLLKYGPIFKITTLGKLFVVVGTPEAATKMFRAEGKYPSRGEMEDKMTWIIEKNNFPNNMAFTKGEEWKRIRSSASKQIVPRRVANYAPGLCEIGDGFVEYIRRKRGHDGYLEDVSSALTKWAFQGIGYMTFGEKLDTFDESRKDLLEFQDVSIKMNRSVVELTLGAPLYKLFPTKAYSDFVNGNNYILEYVLPSAAAENVGDLRFAGKGARSSAGRLEIFLGAGYEWGTVSHRAFDQRSADVACRQLGYEGAKSFGLAMNSSFGVGDSWWTFLNDSRCTGDELHLLRCHWSAEPCARCDHSEDIAIECSTKPLWAVPYEGQVRLIGPYPSKGVVEIYLRSEWGGVCCDNAAFTEANSVCRQLGYTNANGIDYRKHGGVMWINSFHCEESQACFTNCYHYSEVGKDWTQNCATGSLVVSCEYLSEGPYSTSFTTCEWEMSNITATSSPFTTTLELDPTTSLSLLPSSTESIACLSEPATYTCTSLQSDYSCSSQAPLPQSTSMCATPADQTLEMHTFTANPSIVTITLDTTTTAISQATATTTCATETSSPFVLSTSVILTEISMLMTLLSPAPTLSPSTRAATLSEDFQPSTNTNTAGPPDPSTSTATTTPLLSPTPDTPFSINDLLAMALGSFGLLILAAMGIFLVAIICIQCISCYRKRGGVKKEVTYYPGFY